MLGAFRTELASVRLGPVLVVAMFVLALMSASAHAQQGTYLNFKSLLSVDNANWCMDVPGGVYQTGAQLVTANCTGAPDQTFGYENGVNLTAGGLCVDGVPPDYNVVLRECDGSDHEGWALVPFTGSADVFAIANSDGLCITVNGNIGDGTPLVLTQCAEEASQGWVFYVEPSQVPRPVYVPSYTEPQYFWREGRRYCWYDDGWNGAGWYVCGQYLVPNEGYGGPIGWIGWIIPGQPVPFYPTLRPTFFPTFPTLRPTFVPTLRPTFRPTLFPTLRPTFPPPTLRPTLPPPPTLRPTFPPPTLRPTLPPPTLRPTFPPPTLRPTLLPPTLRPTFPPPTLPPPPTLRPTRPTLPTVPTRPTLPTVLPTRPTRPTAPTGPTNPTRPTLSTIRPTGVTTVRPTGTTTIRPTGTTTIRPTGLSTIRPTGTTTTTVRPTGARTTTIRPTGVSTIRPTGTATVRPTGTTTTVRPTGAPTTTVRPTGAATIRPVRPTACGGRGQPPCPSDIELKHDIVWLGSLPNGVGIYRFQYNGTDEVYVGVIAQEVMTVRPDAVTRGPDGYLRVDYSRLGLRLQTLDEWKAAGGHAE